MAGVKISQLPSVPVAPLLTDLLPEVQGLTTYKITLQQLLTLFNPNITGFLPLTGGTLTGNLILNADPTIPLQAATKNYVDTVAIGFDIVLACLAATTTNLNATYANGAAGVGATLTDASGTFPAFTVDGISPGIGDRILVKNQSTTFQNGVYFLTQQGDTISIPWILTRATDYDQPSEITPGTFVVINTGTVNAITSWIETATVTTIGTDPILFSQFTSSPSGFLQAANNLSDVSDQETSFNNIFPTTEVVGVTQAMVGNNAYIANNVALVNLTLPAVVPLGAIIEVSGKGGGGWMISQGAGQQINFGNVPTTLGVAGSLNSTNQWDFVRLRCVTANTIFTVAGTQGNLTAV